MNNQFVTKVVLHSINGFEVEVKTVEVEGKVYVADETDPTKPKLGEDKQPILHVDKKVELPDIKDLSKAELADLAKHNPAVAKMLDDNKKRDEADQKRADDAKKKEEDDAAKAGKWQELAEGRGTELATTKATLATKEEQLGKYVETTKVVLAGLMASIPKENQSLIPTDFSPRQQLEYIIKNAKSLGAKVNSIDGKIDKSTTEVTGTEEDKMVARIEELTKKAQAKPMTATAVELQELRQLGSKLTTLRRTKEAAK